jgi:hypothetical protein
MPLLDNVRPMLDPHEQLQFAMTGQTGVNPAMLWIPTLNFVVITNRARIVAIPDRRIAVFAAGQLHWRRAQPKRLLYSVPRGTPLEHGTGSYSKVAIANEKIWISRQAYSYLDEANAGAGR